MTQVSSYQVPAHPSGLDMRTQLNAIVLALVGDNAGPTAPAPTYPGMMWGNTTAARLYRRNNANTAWVDIGPLDNFMGDVTANVANKVTKTGDTMTGSLTMYAASVISNVTYYNAGGYSPHFRSNNQLPGFEWVNGANSLIAASLSDGGIMTSGGYTLRSQCELVMNHNKGNMRLRGDGGIGSIGGIGFINGAGNAWRWQLTDEGYWTVYNYGTGAVNIVPANLDSNGFQGSLGAGFIKLNEYNYGGYIDLMRYRGEDFQWRIHYNFSTAYLEFYKNGGGNIQMSPDGNIYVPAIGMWISTLNSNIAGKTNRSTQITWASGINELGALAPGGGDVTRDSGNPWAMEGIRCTGGGATWIWPRCIWYATP